LRVLFAVLPDKIETAYRIVFANSAEEMAFFLVTKNYEGQL